MNFYLLLALLIVQRLNEVSLGNTHWELNKDKAISPLNKAEKMQMMILHTLWFLSCGVEFYLHGKVAGPIAFSFGILLLIGCQYVRYLSMKSLGEYWTHLPVAFHNQKITTDGLYRFIRHPNYLIVIIELLLVPLLGHCYFTAIAFTILNMIFITRRIKIEEQALSQISSYEKLKMNKKIIPFIFSIFFIFSVSAETIQINHSSYDEAKKAPTYFKFIGESTKFGLVTTSFDGHATKGELRFDSTKDKLENIVLTVDAKGLDTDNSSRNSKMWEQSLESEKYPKITIKIKEIKASMPEQEVDGEMLVRDTKLPLKINIIKIDDKNFKGSSKFKFTDANIPDPSIAVAKVKKQFDIEFQVRLP